MGESDSLSSCSDKDLAFLLEEEEEEECLLLVVGLERAERSGEAASFLASDTKLTSSGSSCDGVGLRIPEDRDDAAAG